MRLGVPHLPAQHEPRGGRQRPELLQRDRLRLCLLAHHDGLHRARALHLVHMLFQHRLRHTQERVILL